MAFIKRIVVLETGGPVTLYRKKRRRKKGARWLKPLHRRQRRVLKARRVFADEMFRRFDRSSRKRRDGGLLEYRYNLRRARRKALKRYLRY